MIISHKHKFIFIKTVKTAGTSIEAFLSPQCGPNDVLTPIEPPVAGHEPRNHEGLVSAFHETWQRESFLVALLSAPKRRRKFYRHMPAWILRTRIPPHIWNDYFKFCIERNPWDKVLSHYHMQRARGGGTLEFDEYLAKGKFPINYIRYTDPAGANVIVDRVVRYENLLSDLGEVFARLKIPFEGTLNVKAKSEYRTDRTSYQLVYTSEQRRIVERAFAREIELYGYRFESDTSKT